MTRRQDKRDRSRTRVRSIPHRDADATTGLNLGERRRRRSVGELARAGGRGVLWVLIAVVVVRGLGAIFRTDTALHPARPVSVATRGWPDGEARAFAQRFASAFLSVDRRRPQERARALRQFFAENVSDQTTAVGSSPGPGGRVAWAAVAREVRLGASHARITVATISTTGLVRYLAVPIARDPTGGLAVTGLPAIAPSPRRGTAGAEDRVELVGRDAPAIGDLVRRFLDAYLGGQAPAALSYFLVPRARVTAMPPGLRLLDVRRVARDPHPPGAAGGGLAVQVEVLVRDQDVGATFALTYRLRVVRRDRWQVAGVDAGWGA